MAWKFKLFVNFIFNTCKICVNFFFPLTFCANIFIVENSIKHLEVSTSKIPIFNDELSFVLFSARRSYKERIINRIKILPPTSEKNFRDCCRHFPSVCILGIQSDPFLRDQFLPSCQLLLFHLYLSEFGNWEYQLDGAWIT